jgi:phospholipid/cholesterol/gamma-HCH transport system permease protein
VDASAVSYCDGAGANLLLALSNQQEAGGGTLELRGLEPEYQRLLELITPPPGESAAAEAPPLSWVAELGKSTLELGAELRRLVSFVGELVLALGRAVRSPGSVRVRDVVIAAERAGNQAAPIIVLVGLLLGLILAFQSAIPMRQFGAEIFVADLLGISLLRELGPLMASILLAARSGSAFAAEIGTMKINEEIDALTTMALEPVDFLVVPRVIAAMLVLPMLIMLMNIAGLIGGAIVMLSLDFPLVTYTNRVIAAVSAGDMLGGLFKGSIFGIIVAGIGCLRGLQTGGGAGAVGESTTSAVVSGIILIAIADGLFAVLFYLLGW